MGLIFYLAGAHWTCIDSATDSGHRDGDSRPCRLPFHHGGGIQSTKSPALSPKKPKLARIRLLVQRLLVPPVKHPPQRKLKVQRGNPGKLPVNDTDDPERVRADEYVLGPEVVVAKWKASAAAAAAARRSRSISSRRAPAVMRFDSRWRSPSWVYSRHGGTGMVVLAATNASVAASLRRRFRAPAASARPSLAEQPHPTR